MGILKVDRARVLAFRARAGHLDDKLPAGSLAEAARGGLQDSAPRAAVISLHARVEGVTPSAWEDASLVQIWGPRGADYVVPRADVGVFTLGRMPRDPTQARAIEELAADVHAVLGGRTLRTREVRTAKPELEQAIRLAAVAGTLHIRWDASSIWAVPVERPDVDAEDARLELARRFLRWFAPATADRFAWWAGIEPSDARETWQAMASEIATVDLDGEERSVLSSDVEDLAGAEPVEGVRLLPHGDPLIKTDAGLVVPGERRRYEIFPQPSVRTEFWPVAGAVVVDGEVAGSWARQRRRVTVNPWKRLPARVRDEISEEALAFPIAGGRAEVRWTH